MRFLTLTLAILTMLGSYAYAKTYSVDMDSSRVAFSGTHAGNEFHGAFKEWNAKIAFDANNLPESSVKVIFNMTSAETGNAMYDGTLPNADWFDVSNHPEAVFQSTSITKTESGFQATGNLTIRAITRPVTFNFALEGDEPTIMTAEFPIDRLQFDIGKKSDANAEWVSKDIGISIKVTAH